MFHYRYSAWELRLVYSPFLLLFYPVPGLGTICVVRGCRPDVYTASAQKRAEAQWGRESRPSAPPGRPSPQREPPLCQRIPGAGGYYCLICSGVDVFFTAAGSSDGPPGSVTPSRPQRQMEPPRSSGKGSRPHPSSWGLPSPGVAAPPGVSSSEPMRAICVPHTERSAPRTWSGVGARKRINCWRLCGQLQCHVGHQLPRHLTFYHP
ncbi:hypothetical protein NDU88_003796 [Pleurodeles waltl]|uniref:Uncharacterized protein n=1 Tax=Pleurodeles waltl TaxID=8319 RepID=A0AAV7RIG0_PLEWA|nr:hypothetical protein NDU88_003796 [Pleurodeles waltl]